MPDKVRLPAAELALLCRMERGGKLSRRSLLLGSATVVGSAVAACSKSRQGSSPTTSAATTATSAGEYFPSASTEWETVDPAVAGLDADGLAELVAFVEQSNSDSFIMVFDGRIVSESYWRDFTRDSTRDVASVQKSVMSTLIGLARDRGLLGLDDHVNDYLEVGWTAATSSAEAAITIRHLLTMTSGLDPDSLVSTSAPGKWDYNTDAYQNLRLVLESAAGMDINEITASWWFDAIGIERNGYWSERPRIAVPPNALGDQQWGLALTAREMARVGLFASRNGEWMGEQITAVDWFAEAWTPLDVKRDYGYLWWLLGNARPKSPGMPPDLVAALGAQDQKIYVLPSERLVMARQGDAAGTATEAGSDFDNEVFRRLLDALA